MNFIVSILLQIFIILLTNANLHAADETINTIFSGEWWGGVDENMNLIIKIDEEQIYYSDSVANYDGIWVHSYCYKILKKDRQIFLNFDQHAPEIFMPDRNTLLLKFANDDYPPWITSARGKTIRFKRAPKRVDDSYFIGTWDNRKDGFESTFIKILADGTALCDGSVFGTKLCWSRMGDSSIRVGPCGQIDTKNHPSDRRFFLFTPTPVEEAIIVEIGEKKIIWQRADAKTLHWVIQPTEIIRNLYNLPIKSAITSNCRDNSRLSEDGLRIRCPACKFSQIRSGPAKEGESVICPSCGYNIDLNK